MLQMFSHADCDCGACLNALKKRKRCGGRVFLRRRLQHYQYKQASLCLCRPLIFHRLSRLVLICGFRSHIRFQCEASTFSNGSILPLTFQSQSVSSYIKKLDGSNGSVPAPQSRPYPTWSLRRLGKSTHLGLTWNNNGLKKVNKYI